MKKLVIYKTGERFFMDGMILGLHSGVVDREYDLDQATDDEIEQLKKNPHDDKLLQKFEKKDKIK